MTATALDVAPIWCMVETHRDGSELQVQGRISSADSVAGTFRLIVDKTGTGGRALTQQTGDFAVTRGGSVVVGHARLDFRTQTRVVVRFSAEAAGHSFDCSFDGTSDE